LLARSGSFERLAAAGQVRLRGIVEMDVPLHVLDSGTSVPRGSIGLTAAPARLPGGSGLLFATKGHQLGAAVESVRASEPEWTSPAEWVCGIQNGMQKDDVLGNAFGRERLIGAATILGAQHAGDGSIVVTAPGATYLGDFAPATSRLTDNAFELLSDIGLVVQREVDARTVLWSKACNAAGVFGVCVLARCSGQRMSGTAALMRAYLSLVREAADLARAYGVQVGDYPGFPIKTYVERDEEATLALVEQQVRRPRAPGAAESFPSMVQDLRAGRPLEVEGVFGDLVERAARAGRVVPRLSLVCDLLRGIDALTTLNRDAIAMPG
jgi:2-dehydropantoate 2-reductase